MSKLDLMGQYRNDGMAMLYKIACRAKNAGEDPMEAIEAELKYRGAETLSAPVAKKELEQLLEFRSSEIEAIVGTIAVYVLNGHFGFGHDRLIEFLYWFQQDCECMKPGKGYSVEFTDVVEWLKENVHIDITMKKSEVQKEREAIARKKADKRKGPM